MLTCRRVRLVWVAICFFSSSVGYGCCRDTTRTPTLVVSTLSFKLACSAASTREGSASSWVPTSTHPDVLEEPGAHDVGGLLGQDPAFVLGGVLLVAEGVQVLVELELELRDDTETHTETHTDTHTETHRDTDTDTHTDTETVFI